MKEFLWVGLGGCVGSMLRYGVSLIMHPVVTSTAFPWNTLVVNILGSFLIGLLVALGTAGQGHYFLVIGVCGGFTTFSAFSLEMINMLRQGSYAPAMAYLTLSIVLSVLAIAAGFYFRSKLGA